MDGVYFSPERGEFVIEYLAAYARGSISAKLIYSKKPEEALGRYYELRRGRQERRQ